METERKTGGKGVRFQLALTPFSLWVPAKPHVATPYGLISVSEAIIRPSRPRDGCCCSGGTELLRAARSCSELFKSFKSLTVLGMLVQRAVLQFLSESHKCPKMPKTVWGFWELLRDARGVAPRRTMSSHTVAEELIHLRVCDCFRWSLTPPVLWGLP